MKECRCNEREQRTLGGIKCKLEERAVKVETDSDETPGRGANLHRERERDKEIGREREREVGVDTWLHGFRFSRESSAITLLVPCGTFNTVMYYAQLSAPLLPLLQRGFSCEARVVFLIFPLMLLCVFNNKLSFISFLFQFAKHGNTFPHICFSVSAPPLVLQQSVKNVACAK